MTPDPVLEWIKVLVTLIIAIVSPIIAFVLGYWSVRSFERWKLNLTQPVIKIQDDVLPIGFHINGTPFTANRLIIINTGGSGAKDCKVYFRLEKSNEIRRTGWLLPDDNTARTVTLNVNMPEYVDLCAISNDRSYLALTNERGFKGKPDVFPNTGDMEATVTVASSNAQPAQRRIILHATPLNSHGRIVEFVQALPAETTPRKATLYNWLTDWMNKE